MPTIVLKDRSGTEQTYNNVAKVVFDTPSETSVVYYALGEQDGYAELDPPTFTKTSETSADFASDVYYASEYKTSTPSGTAAASINKHDIYALSNPTTNGKFADTLKIFDGDTLVSTHTAPAQGESLDIEDEDIFESSGTNKTISAILYGNGMAPGESTLTNVDHIELTYSSEFAQGVSEDQSEYGKTLPLIEAKGTGSPTAITSDASYIISDLPLRDSAEGGFVPHKWYNKFYYTGNFKVNDQLNSNFTFYPCYYYRLIKHPYGNSGFMFIAGRYKRGLLTKAGSVSQDCEFKFEVSDKMPLESPTVLGSKIGFPKFASALKLSIDGDAEITENGVELYYDNYAPNSDGEESNRFIYATDDTIFMHTNIANPRNAYDISGGIPHSIYASYGVASSSTAIDSYRVANNYRLIKCGLRNSTAKDITVQIRYWIWDAFASTDVAYFSQLDESFTDDSTIPSSFKLSVTGASSSLNSSTTSYTVPPGDHYFYAKTIVRTTRLNGATGGDSSDAFGSFVFAFVLDNANYGGVNILDYHQDYNEHYIYAKAVGDSHFNDSEYVNLTTTAVSPTFKTSGYWNNDIEETKFHSVITNVFSNVVDDVDIYSGTSSNISNMTHLATLQPPSSGTDLEFLPSDYMDSTTYSNNYLGFTLNLSGGESISGTYNPTLGYYYLGTPPNTETAVLGVSGLYQSGVLTNPSLTKTDDLASIPMLSDGIKSTGNDSNELRRNTDLYFPFNAIKEVTDSFGNVFIQFPDMWFRVDTSTYNSYTYVNGIAVAKEQGSTGTWYHVDGFCVAKYRQKYASPFYSKPNLTRAGNTTSYTLANYRTAISTFGSNYTLLDLYHQTVLRFLYWIHDCRFNPGNYAAGTSGKTLSSPSNTGTSVGKISRYGNLSASPYTNVCFKIEDFFGLFATRLEGVVVYPSSGNIYATADKTYFADNTTGKSLLSYKMATTSGMVRAYGWDSSHPFLSLPGLVYGSLNANYNYGYQFVRNTTSSLCHVLEGNYWNENSAYSRGFVNRFITTGTTSTYGVPRLMYHGLLDNS